MIECIINGVSTYPDSSNSIKVTYENPYVKDSGSYTYEISFPMGVTANFKFFNCISRFEVSKKREEYEDCKLFADNRLVISGKGTIKSITDDVVKIQIVGGLSRIKYNAKWESDYIDEIEYEAPVVTSGLNKAYEQPFTNLIFPNGVKKQTLDIDLSSTNMVGQPGKFALMPIYDETNSVIANNIARFEYRTPTGSVDEEGNPTYNTNYRTQMFNLAPQPYLIYILNKVMEFEGFKVIRNDFDCDPWNRLIIANTNKSGHLKDALPHWSVYNLIDEFRKLFNASVVFDELTRTVSIMAQNELLSNDVVSYDCEDETATEYDEDGLKNIMTSNLEYELADSANRSWREIIPQSVRKIFPIDDYKNFADILIASDSMTKKDRQTRIFHEIKDNKYWVFGDFPVSEDSNEMQESVKQVGWFSPIIREIESDESVKLKIAPVAMFQKTKKFEEGEDSAWRGDKDILKNCMVFIPSMSNYKEAGLEDMTEDDNGDYYISVADAMQGTETENTPTDNDTVLQVMFVGNNIRDLSKNITYEAGKAPSEDSGVLWPISFTTGDMWDYWTGDDWRAPKESASLSLANLPHRQESMKELIDKHNQVTIKFITDDIPDPTRIFIFRAKRYICEKIEVNIDSNGIAKEKTGYFYAYL